MRILLVAAVAVLVLSLELLPLRASRDAAAPSSGPRVELVVIEAEGCIYCDVFRRNLLPAYLASARGKEAPVRFVDANEAAASGLKLHGPVRIVPTFIVMRENKEVGRIPGLIGRSEFVRAVTKMLDTP